MLYMFRTILVHLQEQLYELYIAFCICRYVWMLCGYSHTISRRMVPTYTKWDVQLLKVAPEDGIMLPETCKALNRK